MEGTYHGNPNKTQEITEQQEEGVVNKENFNAWEGKDERVAIYRIPSGFSLKQAAKLAGGSNY